MYTFKMCRRKDKMQDVKGVKKKWLFISSQTQRPYIPYVLLKGLAMAKSITLYLSMQNMSLNGDKFFILGTFSTCLFTENIFER